VEPLRLAADELLVVVVDLGEEVGVFELVRRAGAFRTGFGVDIEVDGGVGHRAERGVDAADVLHRAGYLAVEGRALIGDPGVDVAVGDDELVGGERRLDDPREVVRVIGDE